MSDGDQFLMEMPLMDCNPATHFEALLRCRDKLTTEADLVLINQTIQLELNILYMSAYTVHNTMLKDYQELIAKVKPKKVVELGVVKTGEQNGTSTKKD